jgi:hypothetical protein
VKFYRSRALENQERFAVKGEELRAGSREPNKTLSRRSTLINADQGKASGTLFIRGCRVLVAI